MAQAFQPLATARPRGTAANRGSLLSFCPTLTLVLFLGPIAAGLIGTWLPAFGYFPALGSSGWSLDPWRRLFADPALPGAVRLALVSGLLASASALLLVIGFVASCHGTRLFAILQRLLAPLLAVPHVALAIGLGFVIAPSGWLVRLVSPWATGWDRPPDIALVNDPAGLALALGLALKEMPFLFLMTLAALGQIKAGPRLAIARSLGYGPTWAWLKTVLPALYPQIRLPVYAVLAYSLSVVDMALILGPATPPTLAVLVFQWFNDPDLSMRFVAAAGACLQLLLVIAAIAVWRLIEFAVAKLGRLWLASGTRGSGGQPLRGAVAAVMALACSLSIAGLASLALWSGTGRWRYPDALPQSVSLDSWMRQGEGLLWSGTTTVVAGLSAALIALALALGCLENEQRSGQQLSSRGLWLLYMPLLVPQVSFLFGVQILALKIGIDGSWLALIWSHLLFVLPYAFLSLSDPYRALDERYARSALCLGASNARVFWRVKLPMLLRPVLTALAVGFAVSVAQYLPTLFAGSGRFVTLTTEAVSLSAGADRRVVGVYAVAQAVLPFALFALALCLPAWLYRDRRMLRTAS